MDRQGSHAAWKRDRFGFWNGRRLIAVPALGVALTAGLFVLCYFTLFGSLTPCDDSSGPPECRSLAEMAKKSEKTGASAASVEEYVTRRAAKSRWSVSVFLILLTFAAALALSVYVIRSSLPAARRRRGDQILAAFGLAVTAGSFVYFFWIKGDTDEETDPITVFRTLVLERTDEIWLQSVNILGVVVLVFLTAAAAACVRPCVTRDAEEGVDETGWHLRRQFRWLDGVFYAGAGALIAGSMEVSALYRLIATATPGAHSIAEAASAYSASLGLGLSVMLAVLYLPPAFILHRRAQALADWAIAAPDARKSWLESYSLRGTWWDRTARIVTVAAPSLVSGGEGLLAVFGS